MADHSEKDQRQFDPTPRRLARAREEGQVAMSKDLAGTIQLAVAILLMATMGPSLVWGLAAGIQATFERASAGGGREMTVGDASALALHHMVWPAFGFCALCALAMIGAQWSQNAFNWAPKSLKLRWEAFNLPARASQLFSPKKLGMSLLLSVLKVCLASAAVWTVLQDQLAPIATLSIATPGAVIERTADVLFDLAIAACALFFVVAGIDFGWQHRQHWESLKMTRDELKEENLEQEGNPHIKGKRKKLHRDLTMNQILEAIPQATVIVTNPTHLAVAIRYVSGKDRAPVVTAKGADVLAAHIRKLAREAGVPILEHKPLARVLYKRVKVGTAVPSNLYQLVAEVLARVYRARIARGERPS